MPHIDPVPRDQLAEFEDQFKQREDLQGFVPSSLMIMGHRPEILGPFLELARQVLGPGTVPQELKGLVAFMRSNAAGCRYCQAHTATRASVDGVSVAKLEGIWEFETSELFDDAERAALRLALDAAQQPSAVEQQHFDELRQHFDDAQMVELMAVICLFAWLNCWNDSLGTSLESVPKDFAASALSALGWAPGKHA